MTVNKYTVNKRKFHTHSLYMDCVWYDTHLYVVRLIIFRQNHLAQQLNLGIVRQPLINNSPGI